MTDREGGKASLRVAFFVQGEGRGHMTQALTLKEYEKKDVVCPKCKAADVERIYSSLQVVTSRKS